MANNLGSFKEKWAKLSPNNRTILAAGAILAVTMSVGSLFFKNLTPAHKPADVTGNSLRMPGTANDFSNENLSGKIDSLINSQKGLIASQKTAQDNLDKLQQRLNTESSKQNPEVDQLKQQIAVLSGQIKNQTPSKPTDPLSNDPALNMPLSGTVAPKEPDTPDAPIALRIIGDNQPVDEEKKDKEEQITPYLPIGSMFDAVLLNGMDAPTSGVTMKNPVPALLRIKSDAILPNEYRKDVRECFMIVSGYGVLSTERAQLRTESISCVRKDGGVIEAKLNGYVVGEDGKVGMRGRLVSKQGQLIAQSLMVGFVQGIGNAMQPMATPSLNLNPTGTQQYQMPSPSMMAMSGMAGGISNAANAIAQFYLNMAQQMFPVVEVDAGRKVTIILTRGFQFDLSGKYKTGDTVQPVSLEQGATPQGSQAQQAPQATGNSQMAVPLNQPGMPQGVMPNQNQQMQYAQ